MPDANWTRFSGWFRNSASVRAEAYGDARGTGVGEAVGGIKANDEGAFPEARRHGRRLRPRYWFCHSVVPAVQKDPPYLSRKYPLQS